MAYSFRSVPVAGAVGDFQRRIRVEGSTLIQVNVAQVMNSLAHQLISTTGPVEAVLRVLEAGTNRSAISSAHQRAVGAAQDRMLQTYDQFEKAKGADTYRTNIAGKNHRYAGGVLRGALASPAFVSASYANIRFGNTDDLDSVAPQWRRLNWGAGPQNGRAYEQSSGSFNFTGTPGGLRAAAELAPIYSSAIAEFTRGPGPAVRIPGGFWTDAGGHLVPGRKAGGGYSGDQFYPASFQITRGGNVSEYPDLAANYSRSAKNLTRLGGFSRNSGRAPTKNGSATIEGYHFIESGVKALFQQLGTEYDRLFFDESRPGSFMYRLVHAFRGPLSSPLIGGPGAGLVG